MKIDQVIEVWKNYPIFSKIGCRNENLNNSANFEAIGPILVLNCHKCLSTTIQYSLSATRKFRPQKGIHDMQIQLLDTMPVDKSHQIQRPRPFDESGIELQTMKRNNLIKEDIDNDSSTSDETKNTYQTDNYCSNVYVFD